MKIIATTPGGFLLSATEDEVANLLGGFSKYDDGMRAQLVVGATIDARKLYDHWRNFQQIESNLSQAAASLRAAAGIIDTVPPMITPPAAPQPEEAKSNE